jgi:hypothetical protein
MRICLVRLAVPQLGSPMPFSLLRIALGAGFGPGLSHSFFAGFGSLNHWIAWLGLEPARDWRPLAGSLLARRSYHDAPIAPNKYASPRVVCCLLSLGGISKGAPAMGWGTPKICSPSGSQRSFPQNMKISQYGSLNRHKGTAEQPHPSNNAALTSRRQQASRRSWRRV